MNLLIFSDLGVSVFPNSLLPNLLHSITYLT
jgi:hypothetical protein